MPFVPAKCVQFTMVKKWLKDYGPVVGLMFGSQPTVAVIGAEEVLEVLRRDEFQGRPDTFNSRDRAFNQRLGTFCFILCSNLDTFNTNCIHFFSFFFFSLPVHVCQSTAPVVWWSEFLATDPELRVRFPELTDLLRSSGSGTGSTQPREYN
jgi:hypothetical protein